MNLSPELAESGWENHPGRSGFGDDSFRRRSAAATLAALALLLSTLLPLSQARAAEQVTDDRFDRIEAANYDGYVVQVTGGSSVARVLADSETATGEEAEELSGEAFTGAVVDIKRDQAKELRDDPRVVSVERNKLFRVTADDGKQQLVNPKSVTAPETEYSTKAFTTVWGLDRSDQRNLPLNSDYSPPANGAGVHVYVVDSGVDLYLPDFGGRVGLSAYLPSAGSTALDCQGHGTHVAGTAASSTYGMAKGATVHSVRVMDCEGIGSLSGIIAGLNWVADHAEAKSVVNLSVGGDYSYSLNSTVSSLVASGIPVVAAAGNGAEPACNVSPASAGPALTVGAVDSSDNDAQFSNFGSCLDLYAPGVSIKSLLMGKPGWSSTRSGTSMAAPHVTGATAVLWSQYPQLSGTQIDDYVLNSATVGVLKFPYGRTGSPNRNMHVQPADRTAPDTRITSGTSGKVNSQKAKFYFGSTEPGSTFRCRFDSGAWQGCASPKSYRKLANRTHTFQVRATNWTGNTDPTPAVRVFTTAKRIGIMLKPKKYRSVLAVDVNPNCASCNYKVKIQKRVSGKWKTKKTAWTSGTKDRLGVNMPKGKYRVKARAQHNLLGGKSNSVKLRR